MLFNEPKLLKSNERHNEICVAFRFSALQRAEIAEIARNRRDAIMRDCFSALQRAEIAEICSIPRFGAVVKSFSALQRAEIAEIQRIAIGVVVAAEFQCSSTSRNC